MIEGLVHFLQVNVLPWGAMGVLVASVIEEIVAPIPSALVVSMSGFLLVSGPFSASTVFALIFKVAVPAALGVTVGSYFIYFVARFGGKFLIEKWGRYLGLYWSDVEKLKEKLSGTKKDEILITAIRALPFTPSVAVSAFCGIIEMNIARYFVVSFVGIFFRSLILGAVGWQAGNIYERYAVLISKAENAVLVSTILFFVIFIVLKYRSKVGK